ncbi:MAG TPA: hypothetical protein VKA95_11210 [Nitrososphaeraceae archaeon]|nr:hypothetical protein [Nitrososphaeraceae archaeon]
MIRQICNPYFRCNDDIVSVNMIGKCDQCGLENVEISMVKSDRNKDVKLCNQCKPTDGAYGY